jgi:hypothetical protein
MNKHESAGRPAGTERVDTRAAGVLMLASAIVSIVFVALDPEVTATTSRAILESIVANATLHRLVHAVELACVLGLTVGFTSLAARSGTHRSAVRGALIAYVVGCVAMVVAAVTDGFITGDVASYYLRAGHSVDTGREMIHFCYAVVQDFAAASWFFQSVGVLAMAFALMRERGLQRVVGMLGLATGAVPPIAIVATWPTMDTTVVVGILSAQLVWNVAAAVLLMRRTASREPAMAMSHDPLPA